MYKVLLLNNISPVGLELILGPSPDNVMQRF